MSTENLQSGTQNVPSKLWIRNKNNKFVVQKIIEGKQVQIASFPNRALAKKYVDNYKVAYAMAKVVDKEYSFHELFEKFATIKRDGGRNIKSCITKSAGNRYMSHFNNYIKPNFPDCAVHTIGGLKLQEFIDRFLGKHNNNTYRPDLYKTANLVLANLRRFFKWCIRMEYHSNFQSALLYRIPREQEPRESFMRDPVVATVINPKDAAKLLEFVWEHRNDSIHAGYACMIFYILFYFGFRRSEILGLKKSQVNLTDNYVYVGGKFDVEHWTYSTETKNTGSKRKVYFNPNGDAKAKLEWMLSFSNKIRPDSDFLIAATRGSAPLSPFMFRKIVYATYEFLGLAKIKWNNDKNSKKFTIISCPFKGCMSKTWRHLKAAQLIKNRARLELSENYIKSVMGHDDYNTTRGIYGDHDLFEVEEHQELATKIEQFRNQPIKLLN